MNYVELQHAEQAPKKRMEQVKKERKQKWIAEGGELLKLRRKLGLSRAYIAKEAGISYGRLMRFENGEPVKEARLIGGIYKLLLKRE